MIAATNHEELVIGRLHPQPGVSARYVVMPLVKMAAHHDMTLPNGRARRY